MKNRKPMNKARKLALSMMASADLAWEELLDTPIPAMDGEFHVDVRMVARSILENGHKKTKDLVGTKSVRRFEKLAGMWLAMELLRRRTEAIADAQESNQN